MVRLNAFALLVALAATGGATANDYYAAGHAHGHAGDCNCDQGAGGWHGGCCDKPSDCCTGWWDNYCEEKGHCHAKKMFAQYRQNVICNPCPTGCCGCKPCLPKLHMPQLPSVNMPCGGCAMGGCGGCGGCGMGRGLELPSLCLPCLDFHNWRRPKARHGCGHDNCGADCGCSHGGHGGDIHYAPAQGVEHAAPLPPTPVEHKAASADAFRSLGLIK